MIRLGDNTVPYNDQFRLLMITKLPNPEYAPEVQVGFAVVHFVCRVQMFHDTAVQTAKYSDSVRGSGPQNHDKVPSRCCIASRETLLSPPTADQHSCMKSLGIARLVVVRKERLHLFGRWQISGAAIYSSKSWWIGSYSTGSRTERNLVNTKSYRSLA